MKTAKQNNKIDKALKVFAKKTLALGMITILSAWSFNLVEFTNSYFKDIETGKENVYEASVLDLKITPENEFKTELLPGETTAKTITAANAGTLPLSYSIVSNLLSMHSAMCANLELKVSLEGTIIYSGQLSGFNAFSLNLKTGEEDKLKFDLSLPEENFDPQETCDFDLVFSARQEEYAEQDAGYYDDETDSNSVSTAGQPISLNEILPNPEGRDSRRGLKGEWIEIYNLGLSATDLAGWYIEDGSADGNRQYITEDNTLFKTTMIGARGSGYEWLVMFLDGAILNNRGDTVLLYDDGGVLIDQYSFGRSAHDRDHDENNTPGAENEDTGGETAGNEGKSYARIPDGYGQWVDPVPTPGGTNDENLYDPEKVLAEAEEAITSVLSGESVETQAAVDVSDNTVGGEINQDDTDNEEENKKATNTEETEGQQADNQEESADDNPVLEKGSEESGIENTETADNSEEAGVSAGDDQSESGVEEDSNEGEENIADSGSAEEEEIGSEQPEEEKDAGMESENTEPENIETDSSPTSGEAVEAPSGETSEEFSGQESVEGAIEENTGDEDAVPAEEGDTGGEETPAKEAPSGEGTAPQSEETPVEEIAPQTEEISSPPQTEETPAEEPSEPAAESAQDSAQSE